MLLSLVLELCCYKRGGQLLTKVGNCLPLSTTTVRVNKSFSQ